VSGILQFRLGASAGSIGNWSQRGQTGTKIGADIVHVGARPDVMLTRWRFTEMTTDSFHWLEETLVPDGISCNLQVR